MLETVQKIARILYNKKAQNIIALDVKDQTVITDVMLIATGRNALQVKALADEVEDELAAEGMNPIRKEGHQDGRWAVLDYGSILVHIFHGEDRDFYRLDKLWERDGNRIPLEIDNEKE